MNFTDEIKTRCAELEREILLGNYAHGKKSNIRKSIVWTVFDQILDADNVPVNNFFHCNKCKEIRFANESATTQLLRHPCVAESIPSKTSDNIRISQSDIDELKKAAAKFVCLDLRPFNAVECPGFFDIVMAGVKLGQKYPRLTKDDLKKILPGRKAIKNMVTADALDSKETIKLLFREAINQGGLGCTLDLWTDKYKHNTYMAMTANFGVTKEKEIEMKRMVFYMGNITDIVKSKDVIKSRIIDVFHDFGVTEEEIKSYVVFTTDR